MRPERRLGLLLAACLLPGCAAVPLQQSAPLSLPLLSAAALGTSRDAQQILSAAYGNRDATLQCLLQVTPDHLQVVALTALGQRVFSIDEADGQIHAERSPLAPAQLQPANILADIQLAYWPLAALQAVAPDGLRVSEPRPGLRRLSNATGIVAEVHYADADPWNGRLWLVNFEHGYSLDIRSHELADSTP